MDCPYSLALTALDTHYHHLPAWERIVLSFRVVEYCKAMHVTLDYEDLDALDETLEACQVWWLEKVMEQ